MSVEYESTLEDQVDAHMLALRQSGQLRRGMMYNAIVTAVVTGAVLYLVIPDTNAVRFAFAAPLAVLVLLVMPSVYKNSMRRNLNRVCADLRGTPGPIRNRVDVDESGIQITWCDTMIRTTWQRIRVIDQGPTAIHVASDAGVAIIIPNRAFADEPSREELLATMRALREASGGQWMKVGHRRCGACGYDLYGSAGERCPECGASLSPRHVQTLPAQEGAC